MDVLNVNKYLELGREELFELASPSGLFYRYMNFPINISEDIVLTQVVHCKKSKYDIYIGRPSKWGNPFIIGKDGTREEVIEKYRQWIQNRPDLLSSLHELKGKRLGCFCVPLACHGDILVELVNDNLYCSNTKT